MSTTVKEVRKKLKGRACAAADDIFSVPSPERAAVQNYFTRTFTEEIEDRETRDEVERMIGEGCPNADD